MSVRVMQKIFESGPDRQAERHVLLAIANHAHDDGTNAWPSVATLARECAMNERSVHRILRRLSDDKWMAISNPGGGRKSNLYRINLDRLTPDRESPLTESHPDSGSPHPCPTVTPPLTEGHPTPDRESYKPSYNLPGIEKEPDRAPDQISFSSSIPTGLDDASEASGVLSRTETMGIKDLEDFLAEHGEREAEQAATAAHRATRNARHEASVADYAAGREARIAGLTVQLDL